MEVLFMAHMSMGRSHVALVIIELDSFPKHAEVGKEASISIIQYIQPMNNR